VIVQYDFLKIKGAYTHPLAIREIVEYCIPINPIIIYIYRNHLPDVLLTDLLSKETDKDGSRVQVFY